MGQQVHVHALAVAEVGEGIEGDGAAGLGSRDLVAEITVCLQQGILAREGHACNAELAVVAGNLPCKALARLCVGLAVQFVQLDRRTRDKRPLLAYAADGLILDSHHLGQLIGTAALHVDKTAGGYARLVGRLLFGRGR